MDIDFGQLEPSQRYFAMVQSIIPRPIAWVLSDNGEDCDATPNARFNLAPYSFFTGVCSDPPLLMLSAGKKPTGREAGKAKDTRMNIQEREHFVVHIAGTEQIDAVNQTAATLDHGTSELDQVALETVTFAGFSLPRLKTCRIAMGCRLYRMDEIGNTPQAVIYGQIECMYVDDSLITPHASRLIIDQSKVDPLARLGGNEYSALGTILQAARPK